jgi:DNA-binding LacI/PurR family transcriptional regulator
MSIRNGAKNKVTVTSIAEDLGLSPSTVSFVLSGQAEKRKVSPKTAATVKNYAKKVHYVPNYWARGLRTKQSRIISSYFTDVGYWSNDIIRGLSKSLKNQGYNFILNVNWGDSEVLNDELNGAMSRRDRGVIIHPMPGDYDYSFFLDSDIPVVFLGDVPENFEHMDRISLVQWNTENAIKLVIERFKETGKKKFGFIGSHYGMLSDSLRFTAYKSAISNEGLMMKDQWVIWLPYPITYSMFEYDDSVIRKYLEQLFYDADRPDAIFVLNDFLAVKVLSIMEDINIKVPDDVSVISVGDLIIAEHAGLTTLVEPRETLGQVTGQTLLNIFDGTEPANIKKTVDYSELKIRNSG